MPEFWIFLSSGLFLGWSLGANDGSNVFGTAVGTRMVKFRTAAVISSVFVIIGAVFAGGGAAETLNELGSVNAPAGAFMVGLAAALSVYWMNKSRISVSTSQAIVGAIVGWNVYSGKPTDISLFSAIAGTWVLCPVLSGLLAVAVYQLARSIIVRAKVSLLRQDLYTRAGLVLAGAFGAYALGANNIANVMGVFIPSNRLQPLTFPGGYTLSSEQVLFLLGAVAIAVGIATYSGRIMQTVGRNICMMSPLAAWVVVVAQSLVLFLFASDGLHDWLEQNGIPALPLVPVSSSQAVIGAVIGIGLFKGGHGINWNLIGRIFIGWIATPVIAALICFVSLFFLFHPLLFLAPSLSHCFIFLLFRCPSFTDRFFLSIQLQDCPLLCSIDRTSSIHKIRKDTYNYQRNCIFCSKYFQSDHNRSEQCIGRTAKYSRIAKCCTDHRGNTEQISCKDSQ